MNGRSLGVLLAASLLVVAAFAASGCWVRPAEPAHQPAAAPAAPPATYSTPVVRVAPPVRRTIVVRRTCPFGYYWRRGRYRYFAGRWLYVRGRCVARPYRYRARRCRYYPGRWIRVYGGWRRLRGRWRCY
jgi:hypothetical protein